MFFFLKNFIFVSGKLLPCKIPSSYSKLESYKVISSQQELDGVYSLQYSPDGSMLAVGTGNEAMRVSCSFLTKYSTASTTKYFFLQKGGRGAQQISV